MITAMMATITTTVRIDQSMSGIGFLRLSPQYPTTAAPTHRPR
jgi:hypothetical protein